MRTLRDNPYKLDRKSNAIQRCYGLARKMPFMPSTGRYDLTICHEKQFIWFRVAKVGTRTILNHLKESGIHLDVEHAMSVRYPVNLYKNYFKFAFVRNPWDRLVSCWHNKVLDANYYNFDDAEREKMKDYEHFINFVSKLNIYECNDEHLRAQSAMIDLNMIDYLGRLETFDDDAKYIFQKLGLPEKEIVHKNLSSRKTSYQDYYSELLVEKVAQIYQKDIKIFGYQFQKEF
jgi:hypothetical protein